MLTGNPTLDNFSDETTLKFIASDGFNTAEDVLLINPIRLGFWTIFV